MSRGKQATAGKLLRTAPKKGPSPAQARGRRKVVVRYSDGRVLPGFLSEEDEQGLRDNALESLLVQDCEGRPVKVGATEIKAVFFVKSFEGNADYSEFKLFSNRPAGHGVWVRIRFKDGELIEGVAPNRLETYSQAVFYMTPPDPASNNQAALVSKRFLKEMEVLGLASDKDSPTSFGEV